MIGRFAYTSGSGPQLDGRVDSAAPRSTSTTREALLDGPAARPRRWRPTCASCWRRSRTRICAACWTPSFGEDSPTWPQFRDAPAAKHYHQAYRHGLLEHSLTVAQAVSAISATFPGIDRDVAVTGALLHDIGKLEAYETHGDAIEMSDDGRLYGEIAARLLPRAPAIEELDGFPAATAQARAAHHPQPPRLARARQPGGARARVRRRWCT